MLKQGIKAITMNLFEIILNYPNFLLSSLDLMQPRSRGFFSR